MEAETSLDGGFFELCEKFFGQVPVEIVCALVLIGVGGAAIRYLILSIFVPVYHQFDAFSKTGHWQRFKTVNFPAFIKSLAVSFLCGCAVFIILTYPAQMKLDSTDNETKELQAQLAAVKAELNQEKEELKQGNRKLENLLPESDINRAKLIELDKSVGTTDDKSQKPVKEQ